MSRTVKRQMLFWGAMFLLLVGIVLHIHQMEFMAAALIILPGVSYLLSRHLLRGLEVRRRAACRLQVGETCPVTLSVANPTPRPRAAFWVEDTLPEGLEHVEEEPSHLILDLAPEECREVRYTLRARRRGAFQLGPARLGGTDSLGLRDLQETVPHFTRLLVYPRVIPLPDLWPRGRVEHQQRARTRRLPGGIDLRGTREYVPGDDLRHIHWKVSAHRNKLTLVEREQPQGLYATVVLDLSEGVHAGQGDDNSLEYGVTLAASLLALALKAGGAAGLLAAGERDYSLPAEMLAAHRWRLMESLAYCQPGAAQPLSAVVRRRLASLPRGSSAAVVTPQSGPEVLETAGLLASRGLRAVWFLLVAPTFEQGVPSGLPLDARYQGLSQALIRRGQQAYLIRGDQPLEENLRRRHRVAATTA